MKSICLSQFWCALLATGLPAFSPQAFAQSAVTNILASVPRRPSIILIVADGLGYGDLSCNGQTKFQTPNLDRLAAEGIRFTNYHAGGAASAPARAALVLGRDSGHLRQRAGVDIPLAATDVTVAQILKNSGYHTGLIGGWNLGDENSSGAPWNKGFDEFAGYLQPKDATNYFADYMWRYAPRSIVTTNNLVTDFNGREPIVANAGGAKGQYIPDLFTKAALNFVQNNQPDPFNGYRPFFLQLNYTLPGAGNGLVPTDAPFSEERWPQPAKNRAAMIARLDGFIGQLREQLQKPGLTNNVAVFFTSDTIAKAGGGVDPGFFHSNVSSNDLRVPMIVHWPGWIPAGTVSHFKWSAQDFLPTAAEMARARPPAGIDGASVLPVLLGQTKK